jgi:GGDEF domain-containing protein
MFSNHRFKSWLPTGGVSGPFSGFATSHAHKQRWLWRRFHGLESAVLLFCGAYGLLVAMLLLPGVWHVGAMSVLLMVFGVLRLRWPSRSKLAWSADALLALGVLMLIFMEPRTGAGSGPYLFLLILFAITFPLFMEGSHALLYASLLLVVYFAFGRGQSNATQVSVMLFAVRGVLISGLALLSARFGWVLRQHEASSDQMRRDLDSGTYNEHGWLYFGQKALQRCQRANLPFTLAYLNMPPDWVQQIVEARGFKSPRPAHLRQLRVQALHEMAQHLTDAVAADCYIGRDTCGDWLILMPEQTNQQALQGLELHLGRPAQINFGPRRDDMFVSLYPCVVQAEPNESLQDLHARAVDIWQRGVQSGAV